MRRCSTKNVTNFVSIKVKFSEKLKSFFFPERENHGRQAKMTDLVIVKRAACCVWA